MLRATLLMVLALAGLGSSLCAAEPATYGALHDTGFDWPDAATVGRVLSLQDYNTRLVVLSTSILGFASGLVGSFLLLRKRSLMGDALSHATLPGIGIAFMLMAYSGSSGKSLPGLLIGATVTGILGVGIVLAIRNTTRIKDDAAMGIVLSVFFGLGVAVLGMLQAMPGASAAGLENFIYGKSASMVMQDFIVLSSIAVVVLVCSLALMKEFTLLCFDEGFGKSQGWPVHGLDILMLVLVAAVTVVGLQAVGLILIIAFLIIPAAAARFWTDSLRTMLVLAALIGGASGWSGASLSALLPRLPAGAVIVLVAAAIFIFSMVFGSARGVIRRYLSHIHLKRKVGRQHLLRAAYEIQEGICLSKGQAKANIRIDFDQLLQCRSWTPRQLNVLVRRARAEDHIESSDGKTVLLSESGYGEAARITRNHRLWEVFLITHADIAASHVDRDADSVEHVLSPEMVRELERELDQRSIPSSPHPMNI